MNRLVPILGLVLVSSCTDLGTAPQQGLLADFSDISDPVLRWKAYGIRDYSIVQVRTCFCTDGGRQFLVTVQSGIVTGVTDLSDGSALPADRWGEFRTIDDLFALVSSIDTATVAAFRVSYDARYGYPASVYVDPSAQIADEEYGYQTTIVQ